MTFKSERFVDLGQSIYIEWMKSMSGLATISEEDRRGMFSQGASYAFEAAEEFAKVFDLQESP